MRNRPPGSSDFKIVQNYPGIILPIGEGKALATSSNIEAKLVAVGLIGLRWQRPMPPLKLAIIGGGPSAFYVASRILSLTREISVHIYDKLWAPHGLVRYGVAPDHPEVKNCTHKFDEMAQDRRFKFFGNVNINFPNSPTRTSLSSGSASTSRLNVPLASLYPHYTHLVLSTGAPSPVLHPLIPPSESCIPALDIVHWYTSHPSAPAPPPLSRISHITILGMGNVSLDVARILLTPVDHLRNTEMRDDVLDVLKSSTLKHVSVLGRRGPLEAKFGNKEVREMMAIDGAGFVPPSPGALDLPADVKLSRQQTRFLSLLKGGSSSTVETASRSWDLQFYHSPTEMTPASRSVSNPRGHDYLYDLQVSRTTLSAVAPSTPSTPKPDTVAVPTSATSTMGTDLLVTSLGQLTAPISLSHPSTPSPPSSTPSSNPLETLITSSNRIYTSSNRLVKNVYTSGWAAIGARGVLNTTLMDAYSLSDMILTDNINLNADLPPSLDTESPPSALGTPPPNPMEPSISLLPTFTDLGEEIPPIIGEGVKDGTVVTYEDWKVVDEYELAKGKEQGKDRVKLVWSEVMEKGLVRR